MSLYFLMSLGIPAYELIHVVLCSDDMRLSELK